MLGQLFLLLASSVKLAVYHTTTDPIATTPAVTLTATGRPVQFATTIQAPLYLSGCGFVTEVLFILRNVTLDACLDVCEGTKECDYVNYHLFGHHCTVIQHVDSTHPPIIVNIKGFVSGQKHQWAYTNNPACDACAEYESCTFNATSGAYVCSRQGCGEPTFPSDNGDVTGNVNAVGSRVVLGCTIGYWPAPDPRPVSVCQSNGSWSPANVTCNPYSTTVTCHGFETFFQSVLLSDGSVITYRMFTDNQDYISAEATCRNLGAGLVRITNTARFQFVNALMQCSAFSPCIYWVDAINVGGWYETSTGEPLPTDPTYWTEQPLPGGWTGECVAVMGGYGQLSGTDCNRTIDYICELY